MLATVPPAFLALCGLGVSCPVAYRTEGLLSGRKTVRVSCLSTPVLIPCLTPVILHILVTPTPPPLAPLEEPSLLT